MKVVGAGVVFAIAVVVLAKPALQMNITRCRSSANCDEDECCIARGLLGIMPGECRPLANEGEPCTPKRNTVGAFNYKKYLKHCPCAEGHYCELIKIRQPGFNLRCVPPNSTYAALDKPEEFLQTVLDTNATDLD